MRWPLPSPEDVCWESSDSRTLQRPSNTRALLGEIGVFWLLRFRPRSSGTVARASALAAAVLVLMAVLSACITGDDDKSDLPPHGTVLATQPGGQTSGTPIVSIATLTPTALGDISSSAKTAT